MSDGAGCGLQNRVLPSHEKAGSCAGYCRGRRQKCRARDTTPENRTRRAPARYSGHRCSVHTTVFGSSCLAPPMHLCTAPGKLCYLHFAWRVGLTFQVWVWGDWTELLPVELGTRNPDATFVIIHIGNHKVFM